MRLRKRVFFVQERRELGDPGRKLPQGHKWPSYFIGMWEKPQRKTALTELEQEQPG
jgi:hypothetical protein